MARAIPKSANPGGARLWPRLLKRATCRRLPNPALPAGASAADWLVLTLGLGLILDFKAYAVENDPLEHARSRFQDTRNLYTVQPKAPQCAWQFGRACFDLAELATNRDERADVAQLGIAACRQGLANNSNSVQSHYYLGLNLGQLARTRGFGALKLVDQMERELSAARELDPHFDYGGPDRSLGLLYRDAPTFLSVGNRTKAAEHLRKAVELAPDFPENRLNLIESYLKWGNRSDARREMDDLEQLWPKARQKFSGPTWTANWVDWNAQFQAFKKKIADPSKIESPRH